MGREALHVLQFLREILPCGRNEDGETMSGIIKRTANRTGIILKLTTPQLKILQHTADAKIAKNPKLLLSKHTPDALIRLRAHLEKHPALATREIMTILSRAISESEKKRMIREREKGTRYSIELRKRELARLNA